MTPSAADPVTVSGDALPTVQVNGVVWAQTVVGTTVYAAGSFTRARPAGAKAGQSETVRNNLLAYDIRTGELVTSFAPDLNAQALAVAASPDGRRLYVAGDFTAANGQTRNRVAAYDTATGALVASWKPNVSNQVRALAATNDTVWLGGSITAVNGVGRNRLAAVRASDGGLLAWAPQPGVGSTAGNSDGSTATSNQVMGMVLTGNGSQVVVAGRFDTMNGTRNTGVSAIDPVSGAVRPFAINQQLTNQGINSAIYALSTDGSTVYGTAYNYKGPGNLEGTFAARANGGAAVWVSDCLGDSYSSYPTADVVYVSSHSHNCVGIDSFPEQQPERVHKFATAYTTAAAGTGASLRQYGSWWTGTGVPVQLPWYPSLSIGSYTKQYQAGWSVSGAGDYVVYGGEFEKVNGSGQQGLVRFAKPGTAPNRVGPAADAALTPTLVSQRTGTVRVSWQATSDIDNEHLTYRVVRADRPNSPVYEAAADSTWWNRPAMGFVDDDVTPGATYTYRVTVTDPFGNSTTGGAATVTVPATVAAGGAYADTVLADAPAHYWRLDEKAGTGRSYDQAGFDDLTVGTGVTQNSGTGALAGTSNAAATFNGTVSGTGAMTGISEAPNVFSAEAWFNTRSTRGGVLLDFGNMQVGNSPDHDRHVYLDNAGKVTFAVWPGWGAGVTSAKSYNDGAWHHVVASLGPAGLALYLDGQLVGSRTDVSAGEHFNGWWRIGGDTRWAGDTDWFAGRIDEVAVYPKQLDATQVQRHYVVGTTGAPQNVLPTARFTAAANGLAASFDASASTDADGRIARYSWDFGDGTSGSGATPSRSYAKPGAYRVTLTVTDDRGGVATTSQAVSVVASGRAGSAYSAAVLDGGAVDYWRLGESGGNGIDLAGTDDLAVGSGVRRGTSGAVAGDQDTAVTVNGTSSGLATTRRAAQAPDVFSVEAWFRTTSTAGGKLFGYGDATTGDSYNNDRHVYLDQAGRVSFGVYPQTARILTSPGSYNDGRWHQVVASLGPNGMTLSLDGKVVGYRSDTTAGQPFVGYWRIGGDTTWAGAKYLAGDVDDVSVYRSVLSADVVARHYALATSVTANAAPTAAFTAAADGLTGSFDGRGSSDRDGQVRGWAWAFGDGTTGSGATASHTYRAAGTYPVTLTVTDDGGATATATKTVTVTAPAPNQPPTASFTASATDLTLSADGSGSTDPDGAVARWSWDFGDGATATGPTASHVYAAAGSYQVRLTVTDDDGATAERTGTVTATAPAGAPVLAKDTFNRSTGGGLGTADTGGAWTASAGAVRQSVTPGVAELRLDAANQNTGAYLGAVTQTAADVRTSFSLSSTPTGTGTFVYVTGRRVAGQGEYRVRVRVQANGAVAVALSRLTGTTESFPGGEQTVPGLTWQPGTGLEVRLQVEGTGTTQVRATVWASGSDEPATPTLTRTDTTTALQAAGGVGIAVHRPSGTTATTAVRFTGLTVTALG
ncbi:PKD domain-containing protein [Modestobacter sp. NPDC049651]|uniref:PKD domain-containing protein n=1 Tax=unclassified Modestobacter TaxID=2643866 RepID=UPI0033F5A042